MDQLLKNLRLYFIFAHTFPTRWQMLMKKAENFLSALANLTEQLRYVSMVPDESDIELLRLPTLKPRLLAKIHAGIEEELLGVKSVVDESGNLLQELKSRLLSLEQNSYTVNWQEEDTQVLEGTATVPPIVQLLEWAEDIWRYFHTLQLQLACSLASLRMEDEESVAALQTAMRAPSQLPSYLQHALAATGPLVAAEEDSAPADSAAAATAAPSAASTAATSPVKPRARATLSQ